MARQKAVRNEDDLYLNDGQLPDPAAEELDHVMLERGFVPMTHGAYRSLPHQMSDEAAEAA